MVRFPLADPVVHIAVVRHIPWGKGAIPRLGPGEIGDSVTLLVPLRPIFRHESMGLNGHPAILQQEHGSHPGQVDPLSQVKPTPAGQPIRQFGKCLPGDHGLPGQPHAVFVQIAVDASGLPLTHPAGEELPNFVWVIGPIRRGMFRFNLVQKILAVLVRIPQTRIRPQP